MADRIADALEAAIDVADGEADLWEARRWRENADGNTEMASRHAEKVLRCVAAKALMQKVLSEIQSI